MRLHKTTEQMTMPGYKTYLFEYHHEGSWWLVEIKAADMDDAQNRIKKLPLARPLGESVAKVPAGLGLIARAFCWLRNCIWR